MWDKRLKQNQVYKNGVHMRYDFNDKYAVGAAYDYTFSTGDKMYIGSYHYMELSSIRKTEGFISEISTEVKKKDAVIASSLYLLISLTSFIFD